MADQKKSNSKNAPNTICCTISDTAQSMLDDLKILRHGNGSHAVEDGIRRLYAFEKKKIAEFQA